MNSHLMQQRVLQDQSALLPTALLGESPHLIKEARMKVAQQANCVLTCLY